MNTFNFARKMKTQRDEYYGKNPQLLGGKVWKKEEKKDETDVWLENNDPLLRKTQD